MTTSEQKYETRARFRRYINKCIEDRSHASALGSAESFVWFLIEEVPGAAEYVNKLLDERKQK
jgi:hypothetical protein